jgi:hypothetical protein
MYSFLNPQRTSAMNYNGIKLPPATPALDHNHGVGLCPVLAVTIPGLYGRRADTLRLMEYLYCTGPACMCIDHCG